MLLDGKTIIITGAGGALGRVATETVRAQGGEVILIDHSLPEDLVGTAPSYEIDLTDRLGVLATVAKVGPFDGVFNIAGGFAMGTKAYAAEDADWAPMMAMNAETCRNMMAAAVPILTEQRRGAIVNVGAYAARAGAADMGAYIASKAVVMRLTETVAEEVRDSGVNVNAVLPTIIDTPGNRSAMPDADPSLWVSPERLAQTMCFLASDLAADIHGALLPVRGRS